MRLRPTSWIVLFLSMASAHAAEPIAVKTQAGQEVRLGYYSVFHQDCSAGPAPEIRLTAWPAAGVVAITSGTLTTTRLTHCAKVSAPTRQIAYRPSPGFTGSDQVAFDVVDPETGKAEGHRVTISVEPPTP